MPSPVLLIALSNRPHLVSSFAVYSNILQQYLITRIIRVLRNGIGMLELERTRWVKAV
jgi:hypothetical protein